MSTAPLSWIHTVSQAAIDTVRIPLSGFIPAFPWEEFHTRLIEALEYTPLNVELVRAITLSPDDLFTGLGSKPIVLSLDVVPLNGQCTFLMAKEEIDALCTTILTSSYKGFFSPLLQEGFYHYLCMQVVNILNEMQCFPNLTIQLSKASSLAREEALCLDLNITTGKRTFTARLILPASFHEALKTHFAKKEYSDLKNALLKTTPLTAQISLGETTLPLKLYKNLSTGDVVLLNRCLFDPTTKKGTAHLLLQDKPILRLRIKDNHLKILNYAISEDLTSMTPEEDEFADIEPQIQQEDLHEEGMISTEQIPITLVVEAGRIQLTLDELLNLSPGNTLDLSIRPEQGVYLTVQGKRIAKGELIKIGDALGVRILSLGK